jgi:hypothetical protein
MGVMRAACESFRTLIHGGDQERRENNRARRWTLSILHFPIGYL